MQTVRNSQKKQLKRHGTRQTMANPNTAVSIQKKLRILVAEDNEINQKLIQRILHTAGYGVDMVDNGRDAVEFSNRTQYDLILMDIQMPLMDGYEATKRIRNAECGIAMMKAPIQIPHSPFPIPHSKRFQ